MIKNDRDGQINRAMVMDVIKFEKANCKVFCANGKAGIISPIKWYIMGYIKYAYLQTYNHGKGYCRQIPEIK